MRREDAPPVGATSSQVATDSTQVTAIEAPRRARPAGTTATPSAGVPTDGEPPGDLADPTVATDAAPTEAAGPPTLAGAASSDGGAASRSSPRSVSRSAHFPTSTTSDALHAEEVARTRLFMKVAIVLALASLGALLLTRGSPLGKSISIAALVAVVAIELGLIRILRDPRRYSETLIISSAVAVAVGAFAVIYYWGVFSPAPAALLLGIYAFSQNASRRSTTTLYVFVAVSHAVLAAAVLFELVPDAGMIRGGELPLRERLLTQLLVQALYACAFLVSRLSRRAMFEAVVRLERTTRELAQREALLEEARMDLDRALRAGGVGRYTGQLVGSYRLGGIIGRGGMGDVYDARSVRDHSEAAVKLLHPSGMGDAGLVKRFLRETELAARIDCPHVVRVLEVGGVVDGIPYLAMERLHGHELAELLRHDHRRLPPDVVVELVRQVAIGLEAARAVGIVHRDLKPHNVFQVEPTTGTPTWKILDFGVSKLVSESSTLTHGHVVGTPGYMSPEQATGDDVDSRSDVYALAAIAYRALTGHPPFTGKDVPSTLYDVVFNSPTQPSSLVELAPAIDLVLAVGMAKRRGDRFGSARELAAALAAACAGQLAEDLARRGRVLVERYPWRRAVNPAAAAR